MALRMLAAEWGDIPGWKPRGETELRSESLASCFTLAGVGLPLTLLAVLPEELPRGLLRLSGVSRSGAGSGAAALGVGVRVPEQELWGTRRMVGVSGLPESGSRGAAPVTHGCSGDMAAVGGVCAAVGDDTGLAGTRGSAASSIGISRNPLDTDAAAMY